MHNLIAGGSASRISSSWASALDALSLEQDPLALDWVQLKVVYVSTIFSISFCFVPFWGFSRRAFTFDLENFPTINGRM